MTALTELRAQLEAVREEHRQIADMLTDLEEYVTNLDFALQRQKAALDEIDEVLDDAEAGQ